MPSDTTSADLVALAWFAAAWLGYGFVFDHLLSGTTGLNQHMKLIRHQWMVRLLERDNRIVDSALIGHTIHSISFFASTTMLVIAGLVGGLMSQGSEGFTILNSIRFVAPASQELSELKMLLIMAVFGHAFFKFTWALRQYNYCCALVGAAPLAPMPEATKQRAAEHLSTVLTLAVTSFNGGMRDYYFAISALTWFVGPWPFVATTTLMLGVLVRRQFLSRTFRAIAAETRLLGSHRNGGDGGESRPEHRGSRAHP